MLCPVAGCSNATTCGYSKWIFSGGKFKTAVETPGGTMAASSDRAPGQSAVPSEEPVLANQTGLVCPWPLEWIPSSCR